jgi:ABC-type enterobactin transport system permease subunit
MNHRLASEILQLLINLPIVLAGLVVDIRGQEAGNYGQGVMQASRLGPSVFPIHFAAIVGGMMHSFALWRAQKGTSLAV